MDKQPHFANGKICYIEIPAIDIPISASFYKDVFGWQIRDRGDGELAFDDTVGEVSGAWVTGRKPASEPGLMVSIMVHDVADTLELIISHGGKMIQPIGKDLPEVTATFSDPAGNIFCLYQHRM
jgi:predicted enzyme related to lactoylglutathione lyase